MALTKGMEIVRITTAIVAVLVSLIGAVRVDADVTYNYRGLKFTDVSGSAPQVTTSNFLSGFVTFGTDPVADGMLGKSDVVAFTLTDGVRTLSSANGDDEFFLNDFFTFDSSLNIVDWQFSVVPDGEESNGNQMFTVGTVDQSRLNSGLVQDARNAGGGSWTTEPDPTTYDYAYVGLNFTDVTGSAPQATTSDSLRGFIAFGTKPVPNGTLGKSDVVAFTLTDGVRTLSSANGDDEFFLNDFFTFDSSLNIVDWQFSVVPDGEESNGNQMFTVGTVDQSRLNSGLVQDARNGGGGSWITIVPEPSTIVLVGIGVAVVGLGRWRRRSSECSKGHEA